MVQSDLVRTCRWGRLAMVEHYGSARRICMALLFITAYVPALINRAQAAETAVELGLFVGNNHRIGDQKGDLRFADDDAIKAAIVFRMLHPGARIWLLVDPDLETQVGGLSQVPSEYDAQPATLEAWADTLDEIGEYIARVEASGHERTSLFVYFSGHGDRDASLHLANGLLTNHAFRENLSQTGASRIVAFLDGCYLGAWPRGEASTAAAAPPSIFRDHEIHARELAGGFGLIGATSPVAEEDYLEGGIMTMVALSGLVGPADYDDDGYITFQEFGYYVASRVRIDDSGDAPQVVVVPPRRDRLAVVVDLTHCGLGGVRLEKDFPVGQVRIVVRGSHEVVAEFYHDGTRRTSVRLPRGDYDVLRIRERRSWDHPGYEMDRVSVAVGKGLFPLDARVPAEILVLLPSRVRGTEGLPPGVAVEWIDTPQERELRNSPFRSPGEARRFVPASSYLFRFDSPYFGVDLSRTDPTLSRSYRFACAFRFTRTWPVWSRGRWLMGGGVAFQYGVQEQRDVWMEQVLYALVLRHEVRGGPSFQQFRVGRHVTVGLEQSVEYAPGLLTADGMVVREVGVDERVRPMVFPANFVAEAGLSVRIPIGKHLEAGPSVRVEALHLRIPSAGGDNGVAGWEPQFAIGLEFRQTMWRW